MHKTFEQKLQDWWHTSSCTEAQGSEKHHSWPETHFSSLEWFFFYIVSGLLFYRLPVWNTHHPSLCLLEWPTFRAKWCVFRGSNGDAHGKKNNVFCHWANISVSSETVMWVLSKIDMTPYHNFLSGGEGCRGQKNCFEPPNITCSLIEPTLPCFFRNSDASFKENIVRPWF